MEMLPYLAGRTWNLVVFPEPALVTSDHPLTLHSDPESRGPFGSIILSTAQVGGADDVSIAVGPLIVRIVISQIVPLALGMTVGAASARAASRAHPVALLVSTISFLILLAWILIEGPATW